MNEPDFSDVPYQAHQILIDELENSSEELYALLNAIIENSQFLSDKAQQPIDSVQDLIDFINDHSIQGLRKLLN